MFTGGVVASEHKKLDKFLSTLSEHDKMMLAIAVRKDGKLIYQNQVGFADSKLTKPITQDTKFRIGSITKTYTATVILKLVEQGKLKLTQPLSDFFPQIPNSSAISIEQMLRHESGIFSITERPDLVSFMYEAKSRDDLVKLIVEAEPKFKPGSGQEYSNSNFILLSMIAEQVTDKTLAELVEQFITKPLSLSDTYLGQDSEIRENEAVSFGYQGSWQALPNSHLSMPTGAGAMISTARDVSLFMSALMSGEIINSASLKLMTEPVGQYGFGLVQFPFYDLVGLGHGGAIDGFLSNTAYFEQDKIAIAVLSNAVNYDFNNVLIAVLSSVYDKEYELPDFSATLVKLKLTDEDRKSYVGEYSSQQLPLEIKIFAQGDSLMAQATGQSSFELTAYSNREFKFDPAGITLLFEADKQEFTLIQGGGKYVFKRK